MQRITPILAAPGALYPHLLPVLPFRPDIRRVEQEMPPFPARPR